MLLFKVGDCTRKHLCQNLNQSFGIGHENFIFVEKENWVTATPDNLYVGAEVQYICNPELGKYLCLGFGEEIIIAKRGGDDEFSSLMKNFKIKKEAR